ncbi:MAG: response regulator [Gammaproteobacteria bacterium]|nr:response regulator [Gammaproteobacteria bacterium]
MYDTMTALVVDDAGAIRKYIAKLLNTQMGFSNVLQEGSAAAALNVLQNRQKVDLILCDWEMPSVSGFAFLTQLKQHEQFKDIPFIMVTTRNDKQSIMMAIQAGVSEYLIKPFNGQTLETKLSKIFTNVERRGAERLVVTEKTEVMINFKGISYTGEFMDISENGCQLKSNVFKNGGTIYDQASISFSMDNQKIVLRGKLIRQEVHRDGTSIKAAFLFQPVEHQVKVLLKQFIERFKIEQPDNSQWH